MISVLATFFMLAGAAFVFVAAVGVLRFPDAYCRLHAATKTVTLGIIGLVAGAALAFGDPAVSTKAILAVAFYFCTAPVGAHMMSLAARRTGANVFWSEGRKDGLDEWPEAKGGGGR